MVKQEKNPINSSESVEPGTGKDTASAGSVFGKISDIDNDDMMSSISRPHTSGEGLMKADLNELLAIFQNSELSYLDLVDYVNNRRPKMLAEIHQDGQQCESIRQNLHLLPPEAQNSLQHLLADRMNIVAAKQQEVLRLDDSVSTTKAIIQQRFHGLYKTDKGALQKWIHERSWPSISVCQDLQLPHSIYQLVLDPNPPEENKVDGKELDVKDQAIQELRRMIHTLQQEIRWKQEPGFKVTEGIQGKEVAKTSKAESRSVVSSVVETKYLERRKRTRIPTFEEDSAENAQRWLYRYETLTEYLGFQDKEKVEELCAVLLGHALSWYNGLPKSIKDNWDSVKQGFLHQYGGGANPTLAAMDELKKIRQGKLSIGAFAPRLKDLLVRAEIHTPAVQLDYFKDRIRPELRNAVTLGRAVDLQQGIEIATEMERDFNRRQDPSDDNTTVNHMVPSTSNGFYDSSNSGSGTGQATGEQQNYQQRTRGYSSNKPAFDKSMIKCFFCKKMGHMKRDCKKRLAKEGKVYSQNNQYDIEPESELEEEIDIFEHFLNQQEIEVFNIRTNPNRFYVTVYYNLGEQQQVLIDTGSTISTISKKAAERINLIDQKCRPALIRYGNESTQETDRQASWKFYLENADQTMAKLYVVQDQSEEVILGMDWLMSDNILLFPKNKMVKMIKSENINSMELINEDTIKKEFPELLPKDTFQSITNAPYKHKIDTGDASPIASRDYRRSFMENQTIAEEVKKMLASGVIVPSTSNWCSPVVLIKKPNGEFRFCIDYRNLNKVTIKDKYPLPRITELLDALQGAQFFSTIDLKAGYWQLPLEPSDAKKTAFVANGQLYEFRCLPFGVVNGPPSFMRLMHGILKGLKNTMVYLDDVIVFNTTQEEHEQSLRLVLTRLVEYNLKISLSKCKFFCKEVPFLGFLVSGTGIRSNPEKVKVMKEWPTPRNAKGLSKFLGLCAFYHKFLANLSDVAKPLYTLLKKDSKFNWTMEAEKAFQALKNRMVDLPTLAYPDPQLPYDFHCDASNVGLGAVLVQKGRPIAYASKTLSDAAQNYSTTEKECMAIVWSLEYFHPYVYGAQLTIYSDHAALKSILSTKMPRGRIARWILTIQTYTFTICHRKGLLSSDCDALSRLPEEKGNSQEDILSLENFKKFQAEDPEISQIKKDIKKPFSMVQGLLVVNKEDKTLPVLPKKMVAEVINKYHDGLLGGHFGNEKTLQKIQQITWWSSMKEDIKTYIQSCDPCQRYKVRNDNTTAPMKAILPKYTGDIWAADIAELPTSTKGNTFILVMMEYLSKWAVTVALPSVTTSQISQVLLYEVVLKYGTPSRLITDNGSNLVSDAMMMVCRRLGISRSRTSVEHPQTDGLVERLNRTLKISLAAYVGQEGKGSWDTYLPFVTFAYNTSKQSSSGFSPYEILFGHKAVLPLHEELVIDPKTYETEQWVNYLNDHLPLIRGQAINNIKQAQERQQKFYDKRSTVKYNYKPGDLILRKNMMKIGFPKDRWLGPFKVIKRNNPEGTSYVLQKLENDNSLTEDPTTLTTGNVRNMRPYYSRVNT